MEDKRNNNLENHNMSSNNTNNEEFNRYDNQQEFKDMNYNDTGYTDTEYTEAEYRELDKERYRDSSYGDRYFAIVRFGYRSNGSNGASATYRSAGRYKVRRGLRQLHPLTEKPSQYHHQRYGYDCKQHTVFARLQGFVNIHTETETDDRYLQKVFRYFLRHLRQRIAKDDSEDNTCQKPHGGARKNRSQSHDDERYCLYVFNLYHFLLFCFWLVSDIFVGKPKRR